MTRIIPTINSNVKKELPEWVDIKEVIEVSNKEKQIVDKMVKTSSTEVVTTKLFCTDCNKVISLGNQKLQKQKNLASKANKEFIPTCPDCGTELVSYDKVLKVPSKTSTREILQTKNVDLLRKDANAKGTYNTFLDRRVVYNVSEKLADFAKNKGMTQCIARYKRGEYSKEAGNDLSTLNNLEFELEWKYGKGLKARATAIVGITPEGKIIYPKVFKVSSGVEYPFEETYVKKLEKEPYLFERQPSLKKSDIGEVRPKDPSRFRVGSLNSEETQIFKFSGDYTKLMLSRGQISPEVVEQLKSIDPSSTKKYLDWMVKMYIKNPYLDLEELRNYIEEFFIISNRNISEIKDINRFESYDSFKNYMEEQRKRKFVTVKELENDYDVIADNDKIFIVVPYTHEASRKLGFKYFVNPKKGECAWCTTHGNSSFWNNYRLNSKSTLYYVHIKDPKVLDQLKQLIIERDPSKSSGNKRRLKYDLSNFAVVVSLQGEVHVFDNSDNLLDDQTKNIVIDFVHSLI
jgi:hypothetical protein